MNRRVVAAIAAVVLALTGGFLLFNYVQGADARALAGQQSVSVLVVTQPIAKGTKGELARALVALKQLPEVAVVPGALTNPDDLDGKVAAANLMVGEQVLPNRFVDPASDSAGDLVSVPEGMQQVSIVLPPQRVVGARLKAGDTVGIVASFEIQSISQKDMPAIQQTHLMLNKVLVTRVAGAVSLPADSPDAQTGQAPTSNLMITLAVSAHNAEKIVFATEYGKVYLTLERDSSDLSGTKITTAGNIYR